MDFLSKVVLIDNKNSRVKYTDALNSTVDSIKLKMDDISRFYDFTLRFIATMNKLIAKLLEICGNKRKERRSKKHN